MPPQRHSLCARTTGLSLPRQRQSHRRLCRISRQAAVAGDRECARICQACIWRRSSEARESACGQQPAGAGGFLAGRTIWLNAVRTHFPDLAAVSTALNKESVAILNGLSKLTKERA